MARDQGCRDRADDDRGGEDHVDDRLGPPARELDRARKDGDHVEGERREHDPARRRPAAVADGEPERDCVPEGRRSAEPVDVGVGAGVAERSHE